MKFTKRNDRVSKEGTRPGFNDLEDDIDPEDKIYYCALCKGVLDYSKHLESYECKSCVQWYDLRIHDTPLKDIQDFQLVPYGEQRHYPTFDENDPMTPFVESVPLDQMVEEESVETRSYDNGRIQHIKIKGSFADAIKFSSAISAKKKEEDDQ